MRSRLLSPRATASLLLLLLPVVPASAQSLRLVAADDRGVTFQLSLPSYRLSAPLPDGRVELEVPGYDVSVLPGRPLLPYAQALVALPPGAGAVARVVTSSVEEVREDVRLALGTKPVTRDALGGLGPTPAREPVPPILDGPWPAAPAEVGPPAVLRGQRLAAVRVQPFRYDEATHRLWVRRSLTVRVDFTGAAPPTAAAARPAVPATDRHWEPVFRSALANYEQGRRWRAALSPAAGASPSFLSRRTPLAAGAFGQAAFDEDEPEVRIKCDTTGVYSFPYEQLAAQGYPPDVPVGEVSLHRHEYAGQTDPPYVTIELPIEVIDANGDGLFDAGDAILAYVQSWAERSGVSSTMQRGWGDAEVVYATRLRGGAGWRIPQRSGWRASAPPPLSAYPFSQHWERNFDYFSFPLPQDTARVDRFLWTIFPFNYYTRPDTISFETNDLDATHPFQLQVVLQGTDAATHVVFGQVRNGLGQLSAALDSTNAVWSGQQPDTVALQLPATAVTAGLTNALRLWGKGGNASADPSAYPSCTARLNSFDATYWRPFKALSGYLDASSAAASPGSFQVHATGFSSGAIRIYDVTDGLHPERLLTDSIQAVAPGAWAADFRDSMADARPRRYVVFDTPKTPPADHFTSVLRSHLTQTSGEQDYVLIMPEAFRPAIDPLVQLRRNEGLSVMVAPLESVNDEFNGGRKSMYAIKRFLRWAAERWSTRFVLLLGSGSVDGAHVLNTSAPDWVPAAFISGSVSAGSTGYEMIPSDPWYGWSLHDELTPADYLLEPELFVGRLPVNSVQQAFDVVAKLVTYEAFNADQTWRRHMLLVTDDCYSSAATFGNEAGTPGYCYKSEEEVFARLTDAVQRTITLPDSAGMTLANAQVLNLRSFLTEPTLYQVQADPADTCRVPAPDQPWSSGESRAEAMLRCMSQGCFQRTFFEALNSGALWWNWQGHANAYVLAHEGYYRNQNYLGAENDRYKFQNDGKLFLFSAFSCHANAFGGFKANDPQLGNSLGEDMVTLPSRGAVASWASTGYEVVPGSGSYQLNVEFARALFERPPHEDPLGRAVADAGARVPLGEVIALTLLQYLPTVSYSPQEGGVGLSYNLLGDPATRIWIGPTQITVTANGSPVTSGQPVRLASGGNELRLEADMVSNVGIDSIVVTQQTRTGTQVVPESLYTLSPAFPDTLPGGAGGHRYHLTLVSSLAGGPTTYQLRVTDRYGITVTFDVVFQFETELLSGGVPVQANDVVAPDARLALLVLSPYTLDLGTLRLSVDGDSLGFAAEPARGDTSGRQYALSWSHAPYADGVHTVRLEAPDAPTTQHSFRVVSQFALRDAYAFPNPFDDELGTRFVFNVTGQSPVDLLVRVFTASGRLIYESREEGLSPGHHELPWDGLDAEGQKLANGVYFYKLVAHGPQGTSSYDGRLVKLRRPRHATDTSAGSGP